MSRKVAFVLGGGGVLGAYEVGMLQALHAAGIRPDLVVGTSVGALNGASVAWNPDTAVDRLRSWWLSGAIGEVFAESLLGRLSHLLRTGTALHSNRGLRTLVTESIPAARIEELSVPFQCVAASVERARAHWFTRGPLVEAVLASSAVPGLLPPVEIGGEHFYDGGLVHSIPVGRAVQLGATEVYVLHVGSIEYPLTAPQRPWEVGLTAFEIARRHRFLEEVAAVPPGVAVHVLPTGAREHTRWDAIQWRYSDTAPVRRRMDRAHDAAAQYLARAGRTPRLPG